MMLVLSLGVWLWWVYGRQGSPVDVGMMGIGPDDEGGSALETTAARGRRVRASGPPPPVFGQLPVDPSPGIVECVGEGEKGLRVCG